MVAMASQITSRIFTHPFIQKQIKENIKAPRHWALCEEFGGGGGGGGWGVGGVGWGWEGGGWGWGGWGEWVPKLSKHWKLTTENRCLGHLCVCVCGGFGVGRGVGGLGVGVGVGVLGLGGWVGVCGVCGWGWGWGGGGGGWGRVGIFPSYKSSNKDRECPCFYPGVGGRGGHSMFVVSR